MLVAHVVLISFREWLHSYKNKEMLERFREELFSSLSESGFIPTGSWEDQWERILLTFSSLSESGFIPTYVIYASFGGYFSQFSSLSESGFIPTDYKLVAVTFREDGSHLFQRVASFLPESSVIEITKKNIRFSSLSESGFIPTQHTGRRLWYKGEEFSSLSESGFIPTHGNRWKGGRRDWSSSHLFQRVASFLQLTLVLRFVSRLQVLISFREWLHSYKRPDWKYTREGL